MAEPRRILFVCTGNICRSAMAAAIAEARHGNPGVVFESAGVRAVHDAPATPTAAAACAEIGVGLPGHRSRQLERDIAEAADRILVMTAAHRDLVLCIAPGVADRVSLLRADGVDIEDPYGLPLEDYRASRDEIAAAIEERTEDF